MNISQLERLLMHLYEMGTDPTGRRYLATLVWGESGIGKTQTVNHAAAMLSEKLGKKVAASTLMLGQLDVGDLIGLPRDQAVYPDPIEVRRTGSSRLYPRHSLVQHMRTAYPGDFEGLSGQEIFNRVERDIKQNCSWYEGETRTVYALPRWFPEPGTAGILFLDEINRSHLEVRQAIFQLLLDRRMHDVQLPDDWIVVAAANPETEDYDVDLLNDKAFIARFLHIGLSADPDEWLTYAVRRDLDESIRSLIAGDPTFLGSLTVKIPDVVPTPRSWELLSRVLPGLPPDLTLEVAQGIVGQQAALAWERIKKTPETPLTARDVLDGYGTGRVRGSVLDQWTGGLVNHMGQPYTVDGDEVRATQPTAARRRLAGFLKAGRDDLIAGSIKNLELELKGRESKMLKPLFTPEEGIRIVQFLRDYIDMGRIEHVNSLIRIRFDVSSPIIKGLQDMPGFNDTVIQLVMADESLAQSDLDAITSAIDPEWLSDKFGGPSAPIYDRNLLGRLLARAA